MLCPRFSWNLNICPWWYLILYRSTTKELSERGALEISHVQRYELPVGHISNLPRVNFLTRALCQHYHNLCPSLRTTPSQCATKANLSTVRASRETNFTYGSETTDKLFYVCLKRLFEIGWVFLNRLYSYYKNSVFPERGGSYLYLLAFFMTLKTPI